MKALLLYSMLFLNASIAIAQSVTLAPVDPNNPDKGTVVFDNNTNLLKYWNGAVWIPITNAATGTGWAAVGTNIYNANEGNVGVGTNNPAASFNVGAGKTVLFGADTLAAGKRFIWYPTKGALRAGNTTDLLYNDFAKVGQNSVAFGLNSVASGNQSMAVGNYAGAHGYNSISMGSGTSASGIHSLATGYNTIASGEYSIAAGYGSEATGESAVALGSFLNVSGLDATAIGIKNVDVDGAAFMIGIGVWDGNRKNALTVMKSGNIGIGTNSPIAPLHIGSAKQIGLTTSRYFSNLTGADINSLANGNYYAGLIVDYNIVTKNSFISSQSYTSSDSRIKNIIGLSDSKQDLDRLNQIRITDYNYKDLVNRGSKVFKKVIAQEVEEVYPEAVSKMASVIPDIYTRADKAVYDASTKSLSITMAKNYELKTCDKVKLIHPTEGEVLTEIEAVEGNTFMVKNWLYTTDKIFVYGREVNDFRVVDYEALSMLGISAIQELAKELEDLKKQASEIEDLRKQNKVLKNDLMARIEVLETRLVK